MKFRIGVFALTFIVFASTASSQQKAKLSHDDYASWNVISNVQLSSLGHWVLYELNPQDGDGMLVIRHLESQREQRIPRGYRAAISPDGYYAAFHIKPQQAATRKAKVEKKKSDQMPTDSLGVFIFDTWQLNKYPALVSYSMPKESSDWMTYIIDATKIKVPEAEMPKEQPEETIEKEETEQHREKENDESEKKEKPGKSLHLFNPITEERLEIQRISDHSISEQGNIVAGLTVKEKKDTLSLWDVFVVDTQDLQLKTIDSQYGEMKQLNIDKEGRQVVWMFSSDTTKTKSYSLFHYVTGGDHNYELINSATEGLLEGHGISEHSKPYFSDHGRRLFLGTAPIPLEQEEDTLLNEERYSLDIWHWEDPMLQPQQKVMVNRLRQRSFLAVYDFRQSKLLQLGSEELPNITLDDSRNSMLAMGENPDPYMVERQWTGGNPRDLYAVNMANGSREKVAERIESAANISPGGNYLIWYDADQLSWQAYSFARETTTNLTVGIDVAWDDEDNDLPMFARPHGLAGWTPGDREVLIYDRFDVWKVDPTGDKRPENLTSGYGRENQVRLRIHNLDRDDPFVRLDQTVILNAFHETNMQSGFFAIKNQNLELLIMDDASFSGLQKANNAENYLFRRSTFYEYPDIWICGMDFSIATKVSDANPRQSDYYWGDVQMVEWQDFNNDTLKGLMYFPEDLDKGKKYPMLVYFYERSSQGLHSHFIPSPSRSTINRPYCTSNGYIVFIPDITYEVGFPGESAYNAIVSGTKAMTERYPFIDRENMGLQGQSWGGYQIAYLITRTNMFKAAMAGAPVSNMVSAYGGIRWQTGLNRQFQYEQAQSRIGGTLWEKPLRYIENSPVFFADKIHTPLLMMHNDDDGAVPWYQGIELFTAMRRLSKPVWMLVYNGEAHNLTRWPNRMDLSVRMYQFFDHYLKDEPSPAWLKHGIPATEKGKTHGYELLD